MLHEYLPPNAGNDNDDTFELLEQSQTNQRSGTGTVNDDLIKPTARLPAKPLPLRSTTQTVRSTFWIGCLAAAIIIILSVVASKIINYLPDTSFFSLNSQVSCDLMFQDGSAFQHAFTIDLRGSTELTFSQAKAIDIIWQLFVGMGGRLVMALVAYKVFMDGLARIMEDSTVSYQLYASLTFSTTSLLTTGRAIKGAVLTKGWRGKAFFAWFAISSIYVLGFPTLISATAGYLTPSTAGFKIDDNTFLTPDSSALRSCYEVNAGALIGFQNGTVAQGPPVSEFDVVTLTGEFNGREVDVADHLQQDYSLFASLLNATLHPQYAIFQYNRSNISQLRSEGLNVQQVLSNYTSNVTIEGRVYVFKNWRFRLGEAYVASYCHNNQTLPDLSGLAECLPETYFVWGLSSLLLEIVLCLQIVWIFGMYFVWLDANIYSAICRSGRRMRGEFRAAADLSGAMGEVLGDEICAYSDDELKGALKREPGLRYYATGANEDHLAHIGVSSVRIGRVPYNSAVLYGGRRKGE